MAHRTHPVPVILDTDIGTDIDDTWAIGMMLKSPELDVKLIVSDEGDTVYRARLIAKLLGVAGRTDIAVGTGIRQEENDGPQAKWIEGYALDSYAGVVHADGVDAIVRTIMDSPEPVTLICIGPVPNIADALRREPGIAQRARFVGMHGSIAVGHGGKGAPEAEYNVKRDVPSCRAVFEAPWLSATVTPLDTCGLVRLAGERYGRVLACEEPLMRAVIENYTFWCEHHEGADASKASSVLFDTVAIHLAYSTAFCRMERMGVRVDDEGMTVRDEAARVFDVALAWNDLDGYLDALTERLCGEVVCPGQAHAGCMQSTSNEAGGGESKR